MSAALSKCSFCDLQAEVCSELAKRPTEISKFVVLLQEFIVHNKSSRWECRFTEAYLQEDKDICGSVTEQ